MEIFVMEIEFKTVKEDQIASIYHMGPVEEMGEIIGELTGWTMEKGIQIMGPPFVVYYTSPLEVPPDKMEYDVGIPIQGEVKDDERAQIKVMPQHHVLSLIYQGPYYEIGPAYGRMMEYIAREGFEMIGAPRELYINSPLEVPESEILTEIQFPIIKKSTIGDINSIIEFYDIAEPQEVFKIYKIGEVKNNNSKTYLEIMEPYRPALKYLADFSHVMVFWWADRFSDDKYRTALRTKPPYANNKLTGVFATRAEYRPNPLASTTCRVIDVNEKKGIVEISGIDAFDETPIIDVKPYIPAFDRVKEPKLPKWLSFLWPEWKGEY